MRTKEAYLKMISLRNIGKVLELDDNYVRVHRTEVKKGKYPSIDKMEERLNKAGYRKLIEASWCEPPPTPPPGKTIYDLVSEEELKAGLMQVEQMKLMFEVALAELLKMKGKKSKKEFLN